MQGLLGSGFQGGHGMFARQRQQAMQYSRSDGAALGMAGLVGIITVP